MSDGVEKAIEERYQNSFGRRAGYLPKNRAGVDRWLVELQEELGKTKKKKRKLNPAVEAFGHLIEHDGVVRMLITQMIEQVPAAHKQKIENVPELLAALDFISRYVPRYHRNPAEQNNFFPMSNLFTYMMMTPAGEAAFRNAAINDALRMILKEWCHFLDSPESCSVLNEGEHGWLSQPAYEQYKLYEFELDRKKPHWGFKSWNKFFHRQIKPEFRPVAEPNDPKVIVSANDGTVVTWERNVKPLANFWLKGQPYSLINMLNVNPHNRKYAERLLGGDVFQSFLSGADYHRWHSPIEGIVRYTEKVEALMFSDAESAGPDPTAATYSQGYEASVNTRGLVFIESPKVGMVCVIPIGITEISSVTITVKPGEKVAKGAELGYFSYGGSSLALVFEKNAIDRFTVPRNTDTSASRQDDGPPIYVNAQIAVAR